MNRLTRVFLSLIVVTTIFALTYPALAMLDKTEGKEGFGMEISMEGRQPFTMPVKAKNERLAFLPVRGAKASAVKVIPSVEGNSIKFEFLAIVDKLPEIPTCDNIKKLQTERVASYIAHEGDVIRVADFEKYGVAPFTLRVMSLAAVQTVCPEGACCCGVNTCYPNPGACIQCGNCGTCCRTGGGGDN
jgi:hypothetical protein